MSAVSDQARTKTDAYDIIVINGLIAAAAVRCLVSKHQVHVFTPGHDPALLHAGAVAAANLGELSRGCDALVLCLEAQSAVREVLFASDGIAQGLLPGKIVIDQTPGKPDQTRLMADDLWNLGIVLVDATIRWEQVQQLSAVAAIMCGGPRPP